ncbi:MAG: cell surface protein [Pseudobutyrivibrio sp.]|nr:cell surface protein [Pseudobutyrivibrio sp.]
MKFSKKYFCFVLILTLALVWKLNTLRERLSVVEAFRGASIQREVFYPLMSKNINDNRYLHVYINDKVYNNYDYGIIMDDNMQPAASLAFIREEMGGCAYRSDSNSLVVQIKDDVYEFILGKYFATKNGDEVNLTTAPIMHGDGIYIGLNDLCNFFNYQYFYEPESQDVFMSYQQQASLPRTFDLRKIRRISFIRDQGSSSACWACASLEALESSLKPFADYKFSVDKMVKDNSFDLETVEGGKFTMALAYLLAWQGPVEEYESETAVHLQEAHFYDADDVEDIKRAVYKDGGVSTSIYASALNSNITQSANYNKSTNSYCYLGSNKPNHEVVIVGWDDDYPAEMFKSNVPGDGAFICQNSWGDRFGEDGVFYISYYDSNIGKQAVSYSRVDELGRYDNIYQSDLCGWVGQMGYGKNWVYGANTYTALGSEEVRAAGFYALKDNTNYQLFFVNDYENTGSLARRTLVAEGSLKDAGYYTIEFTTPAQVKKGEDFAVVLYINTPGTNTPMALEYVSDEMTRNVDITDGKGFISNNGLDWECVEDVTKANLCLKAYSKNVKVITEEIKQEE